MRPRLWRCGRFDLPLGRPLLMGVVNLTPDSFSDGGRHADTGAAVAAARAMIDDGADIVDLGAESTRPGASSVSIRQELSRLMPVLNALAGAPVAISVDTRRAEVMRAALDAGADIINDVSALREPGSLDAVRASGCGVCLMHMLGRPSTMQHAPEYRDVLAEVADFLEIRAGAVAAAGVDPARIAIDPGIGFGKTVEHNLRLLAGIGRLARTGYPVLVGVSRKSLIGALTGRGLDERQAGSVAAALAAVARGAAVVRVHDVRATRDALTVWRAIERGAGEDEPAWQMEQEGNG